MPIYTRETLKEHKLPWVEVDDFEFFYLSAPAAVGGSGSTAAAQAQQAQQQAATGFTATWGTSTVRRDQPSREFKPTHPRERVQVLNGEAVVDSEYGRVTLKKRDWVEIPQSGAKVSGLTGGAELLWLGGTWKQPIRQTIFQFRPDKPLEVHYHDGQEYWFVFRGHFKLQYDGEEFDIRPGHMLAFDIGYEHGVLEPAEVFEGVGFALELSGQMRDGHLERDRHGVPTHPRELPFKIAGKVGAGAR